MKHPTARRSRPLIALVAIGLIMALLGGAAPSTGIAAVDKQTALRPASADTGDKADPHHFSFRKTYKGTLNGSSRFEMEAGKMRIRGSIGTHSRGVTRGSNNPSIIRIVVKRVRTGPDPVACKFNVQTERVGNETFDIDCGDEPDGTYYINTAPVNLVETVLLGYW